MFSYCFKNNIHQCQCIWVLLIIFTLILISGKIELHNESQYYHRKSKYNIQIPEDAFLSFKVKMRDKTNL